MAAPPGSHHFEELGHRPLGSLVLGPGRIAGPPASPDKRLSENTRLRKPRAESRSIGRGAVNQPARCAVPPHDPDGGSGLVRAPRGGCRKRFPAPEGLIRPHADHRETDPPCDLARKPRRREADAAIGPRARRPSFAWRKVPAPRRGELVRLLGRGAARRQDDLGRLVTLEAGKIVSEGLGEVQEMIDICDFRGRPLPPALRADHRDGARRPPHDGDLAPARASAASSRPSTFPVAVWSWNAALAFVCGDPVVGSRRRRPRSPRSPSRRSCAAPSSASADAPEGLSAC
jgi:hypothetical protein